jgi:diguanylate cyclase (GGDEF)-like protein
MRYLLTFIVIVNVTPFIVYTQQVPENYALIPASCQFMTAVFLEIYLVTILILRKLNINRFSRFEKGFADSVLNSIDQNTREHILAMNKDLESDYSQFLSYRPVVIVVMACTVSATAQGCMAALFLLGSSSAALPLFKVLNFAVALLLCIYAEYTSWNISDFHRQLQRMGNMCSFYAGQELKKSRIFYAITDILRLFNRETNLKVTLKRILQEAKETLNMDIAVLEINEKKTETFYRLMLPENGIEIGNELLNHIKGTAQLVRNVSADPFLRPLIPEEFHNFIYTPLFSGDGETAAGFITGFSRKNIWQDGDLALLRMLAMQANILLNNAALFEEVQKLSITDGLTRLFNRRYFSRNIENEVSRAARYDSSVCLLMVDIDNFKHYNDTNGHPAGDYVLSELADIMKTVVRETDIVTRYGGEEFAIILPETDKEGAARLAERLRRRVQDEPFKLEETQPEGQLTISIGVACAPDDAETVSDFIDRADEMLYKAKNGGRNRVCVTPDSP